MIIGAVILFIAILCAIILVHEWGHFVTARRAGIKVEEFGMGFPPKAYSWVRNGVVYSLNWLPIGGFVKIYGEDGDAKDDPMSFGAKSIPTRIVVILAGVTMNFILAAVLLAFGFWYGIPSAVSDDTAKYPMRNVSVSITQIAPGSPAESAGLKIGDAIRAFTADGARVETTEVVAVQEYIQAHKGTAITMIVARGEEMLEIPVTPRMETPAGEGAVGVALQKTAIVSYPWYLAPFKGIEAMVSLAWLFLSTFASIVWHLITNGKLIADIAGPVGIGALTYQVTQLGFSYIIQLAAILSINIGIINALPFPALDGGRAAFLLVEAVKGSPLSKVFEYRANMIGFALLMILMVLITVRDIFKLF
ncbi:MAG: site-2 protease family protein [Patescibacteria group bacterium]